MTRYKCATSVMMAFALLVLSVSGQTECNIVRDTKTCPEAIGATGLNFWKAEYKCLMAQNDLRTIMDCVKKDNGPNINDEVQICRSEENGLIDDKEDYFEQEYDDKNWYKVPGKICLKPRAIMTEGPPLMNPNAVLLSIYGAIRACPYGNANFHKCLCGSKIELTSLQKLSTYFVGGYTADVACSRKVSKRTDFLDDVIHKPHMHQARDNSWGDYVHKSYFLVSFTIDDYGRPIYYWGSVGDRLPYFDQYVRDPKYDYLGTLARRCYIHPEVNDVAECRTWVLTSTTVPASSYSVYPEYATYRKNFTQTASYSSLQTVAPSQTDVPTAMAVVVNNTNVAPTTSTPVETGATQTGATGAALPAFRSDFFPKLLCSVVMASVITAVGL